MSVRSEEPARDSRAWHHSAMADVVVDAEVGTDGGTVACAKIANGEWEVNVRGNAGRVLSVEVNPRCHLDYSSVNSGGQVGGSRRVLVVRRSHRFDPDRLR